MSSVMILRLQELCKTCASLVGRSVIFILFLFAANGRTARPDGDTESIRCQWRSQWAVVAVGPGNYDWTATKIIVGSVVHNAELG